MAHVHEYPRLPDVSSKYGAPMGRREYRVPDRTLPFRFHLSRVYVNSGGYDRGGAYWGFGAPLYQASADPLEEYEEYDGPEMYVRASTREAAKHQIRLEYPNARFYR